MYSLEAPRVYALCCHSADIHFADACFVLKCTSSCPNSLEFHDSSGSLMISHINLNIWVYSRAFEVGRTLHAPSGISFCLHVPSTCAFIHGAFPHVFLSHALQALVNREVVCGICTEEDDDFIPVNPNCHLVLLMDPLDGKL